MAIHPLQRLLLDVEAFAVRFETLRLEYLDIVWQLRQHANRAAVNETSEKLAAKKKRATTRKRAAR